MDPNKQLQLLDNLSMFSLCTAGIAINHSFYDVTKPFIAWGDGNLMYRI